MNILFLDRPFTLNYLCNIFIGPIFMNQVPKPKSCDHFIHIFEALIILVSALIAILFRNISSSIGFRLLFCILLLAVIAFILSVCNKRIEWLRNQWTILCFISVIAIVVIICVALPVKFFLKGQFVSEDRKERGKVSVMTFFVDEPNETGHGTITDDSGSFVLPGVKSGKHNIIAYTTNDDNIRHSRFSMLAVQQNVPPKSCPFPLKKCKLYKLETIYFDHDSARLNYSDRAKIHKVAEKLDDEFSGFNYRLFILGHTSSLGSDNYNLMLGCKRAEAVRDEVLKGLFNPERIHSVTFGERDLIDFGGATENHAKNRRVEFVLLPYGQEAEQMMANLGLKTINVLIIDS